TLLDRRELHGMSENFVIAFGHHQCGDVNDVARFNHCKKLGIHAAILNAVDQDVSSCAQDCLGRVQFCGVRSNADSQPMTLVDGNLDQLCLAVEILSGVMYEKDLDEIGLML